MRIRFKQVCEERRLVQFARKMVGGQQRMMIKVYILCESANSDSTWKSAERYFLTMSEYSDVHNILLSSFPPSIYPPPDVDTCCICFQNPIERRLPECKVTTKQHGFCTSCIHMWLEVNDTCPICRKEVPGQNPRNRVGTLQTTLRFIPSEHVQRALRLIMHAS